MIRKIMLGACVVMMVLVSFAAGRLVRTPKIESTSVPAATGIQDDSQADPLDAFRTEREQLRQMQRAEIGELIHSENVDQEVIRMAETQLLALMDSQEKETTIEGVLRARGFVDAIATVHTDSVNILVRADSLSRQQTAIILELVMRETGISGGNVKIIPIN